MRVYREWVFPKMRPPNRWRPPGILMAVDLSTDRLSWLTGYARNLVIDAVNDYIFSVFFFFCPLPSLPLLSLRRTHSLACLPLSLPPSHLAAYLGRQSISTRICNEITISHERDVMRYTACRGDKASKEPNNRATAGAGGWTDQAHRADQAMASWAWEWLRFSDVRGVAL